MTGLFSLRLFISVSSLFLFLFFLSLSHTISIFHCLFVLISRSFLLSLLFILSPSFTFSLTGWQTEGWWVCCRSNSFIQPLSVGTGSISWWRHTNTTVFPRRNDLVVSVRKQNEARQHDHPSLHPSLIPPSVRHARLHVDYTPQQKRQQTSKNKWIEPHNYRPAVESFFISDGLFLLSDVCCLRFHRDEMKRYWSQEEDERHDLMHTNRGRMIDKNKARCWKGKSVKKHLIKRENSGVFYVSLLVSYVSLFYW